MDPQILNPFISVIIPVFNDEEVLVELHRRLRFALEKLSPHFEVIYIDDGSSDGSLRVLLDLQAGDDSVVVVQLLENYGQSHAINTGLEKASGELVVVMDSDLQDRPEDIAVLIKAMQSQQAPMAIAISSQRQDSLLKILLSRGFNFLANKLTDLKSPIGVRVFRVIKRELIDELKKHPERPGTALSFLIRLGFKYALVELPRESRFAGKSGYTLPRLLNLALQRVLGYSLIPFGLIARIALFAGAVILLLTSYLAITAIVMAPDASIWMHLGVLTLFGISFLFLMIGLISRYCLRIQYKLKEMVICKVKQIYQSKKKQPEHDSAS